MGIAVFLLPSVVMTALYIKMYIIIMKRNHLTEESAVSYASHASTENNRHSTRSFQNHYQTKVARNFAIIIIVQLVCWYPYTLLSIIYNFCPTCPVISSSAFYFLLTIGYSSCAINPYLYAYQQRSFRQVFHKMLRVKNLWKYTVIRRYFFVPCKVFPMFQYSQPMIWNHLLWNPRTLEYLRIRKLHSAYFA